MKEFIVEHLLDFLIGAALAGLSGAVIRVKQKYDSLQSGMLSLLRAELIRSGEKYLEQEYVPVYAKDAYDKAYKAYHGLGGNGTMTEMHNKVMSLSTTKPKGEE